jgi:hypothetical protein
MGAQGAMHLMPLLAFASLRLCAVAFGRLVVRIIAQLAAAIAAITQVRLASRKVQVATAKRASNEMACRAIS